MGQAQPEDPNDGYPRKEFDLSTKEAGEETEWIYIFGLNSTG